MTTVLGDFKSIAEEHAPFNAAIIAAVLEASSSDQVVFHGEREHLDIVRQSLKKANIDFTRIRWEEIQPGPRHAGFWRGLLSSLPLIFGTLFRQSKDVEHFFFTGLSLSGIAALKCFVLMFRPKYKVSLVNHGELARLLSSRRWAPLLTIARSRVRHIVLGEGIRDIVIRRFPSLQNSLVGIQHPYLFPSINEHVSPPTIDIPCFAFLGLADESKGFPIFQEIAKSISEQFPRSAKFVFIGHFTPSQLSTEMNEWRNELTRYMDTPGSNTHLPRAEYEIQLSNVTYVVMPYDPVEYSLIASGSMLDCFAALKPWIALRNSEFEMITKKVGNVGYLCDSTAEMARLMIDIVKDFPAEQYRLQCQNLQSGRKLFSPALAAMKVREIL